MRRRSVAASAPTRIDLAGGTLDIWPISVLVPGAVTVNVAVELRATVVIRPRNDPRVVLISADRRRRRTLRIPLALDEISGSLSLLARLVAAFEPGRGLTLTSRAMAPAGAGLGGSSSLGIAVGTALDRYFRTRLGGERILRRVMNLETIEIGVPAGNQDYLAARHGGLAAYDHGPDGTRRRPIRIPDGLEDRLILAYTGEPRRSGTSNWEMFRRFVDGDRGTRRHMHSIASIAREMVAALEGGELDEVGRLLREEGRLRYRLAPSVATRSLLAADRAARRSGAIGTKVCGAGGGGCLVAFARAGRGAAVAESIASTGAIVLTAPIARRGARAWDEPLARGRVSGRRE